MRSLPRQHLLSLALATAFGSVSFWSTGAVAQATGQEAAQVFDIHVPAQALASAINELSRQTGTQMFAAGELVAGLSSRAVNGRLTSEQALRELLAGTSLEATRTHNGGFAIRRPAASGATLPTINVTDSETAAGPVQGYVARRSSTGTKTDTPILETPQSITVIGAQEIETLKSQSLQDALGYAAGVTRAEGLDRTSDSLYLRGFRTTGMYRDGSLFTANIYDGRQEPYGLERIELLKGASSVIFGSVSPGGVVNTVSKRPTTEKIRELNIDAGSFGRRQVSGDFAGALDDEGKWSYRLVALKRDSDSFIDHVPDDRTYIAPSLKWQPDANTSLTLLAEVQKDRTAYVYGLPAYGTLLPYINGQIPRNRFIGEAGRDKFDLDRYSIGYLFEHAFSEKLKLRNSMRYYNAKSSYFSTDGWGLSADQRSVVERYFQPRWDRSSAFVTDTSLQYQLDQGRVKHTMLVGFDYALPKHETERYEQQAADLDVFNPVYGKPVGPVSPYYRSSWKNDYKRLGIYAQDQIKIDDKWVVLLGGRYDKVRFNETNFFTGDVSAANEKSSAFTGRLGVVYLAANGLAPFFSYSESFEPTQGQDRLGSRFKPTTGQQYEAGVRYQPSGSRAMISAAVFQLTRQNLLVPDPQDASRAFNIQAGEVRSRGFELEARSSIGRNVNIIAAYAYTDARTTQASPLQPDELGKRSIGVPYNQISLWGDYSFGDFGLAGLKVGMGARYLGQTRGLAYGVPVSLPAFTLVDAMVSYTTGPWRFALNLTNLTDKTYIASCSYGCFYGEPRKVIGTATYRW